MPANYKGQPKKTSFLGNIDTLYFSVDVLRYDDVAVDLLAELHAGLDHAYENDELKTIEIGEVTFEILPWGKRPNYRYQIRNKDLAFFFATKRTETNYPIYVQVNQLYLWEYGHEEAITNVMNIIADMGFVVDSTRLSRVDPCCHTDQWRFDMTDQKYFVYPSACDHPDFLRVSPDLKFETMYVGRRNNMQIRIYDKSRKIKKDKHSYFNELYEKNGIDPDQVWNIEFELHRKVLKELGFDTVDDLCARTSELWAYCTKWFRMMDKRTENSRYWKQKKFWDYVQNCTFGEYEKIPIRQKHLDWTLQREVAQIRGRLKKFALRHGTLHIEEATEIFKEMSVKYEKEKDKDFAEDVKRLAKLYMSDMRKKEHQHKADE